MKELRFEKVRDFEYGLNTHQPAQLYSCEDMADFEVLYERELTYDNIVNLNFITNILSEFFDVNAVAISKHENCCGLALAATIDEAYDKAFDCDPVSSFHGVIGFTKPFDIETASHINSMGVRFIVAPDFDKNVVELFEQNESIKLVKLKTPLQNLRRMCSEEVKITPFGVLVQGKNDSNLDKDLFKVITKTKPTSEQIEDAIFAWKAVKHLRTDSAVVVKDFNVKGISQGNTNSIAAVENALNSACDGSKDSVIAIDGAITTQEIIFAAIQGRVKLIIHGGSDKDKEMAALADKYELAIISTGIKNYRY